MNSKVYKWCAVPLCTNTSLKTPNKLFVSVPYKKSIRDKWLKLARRDPTGIHDTSQLYFCEDHFDLPNDMENYMEYHVMGSVAQIRKRPGCMPTKFQCHSDTSKVSPPQCRKQRKRLIQECTTNLEETVEHVELRETFSGSSGVNPATEEIEYSEVLVRLESVQRNESKAQELQSFEYCGAWELVDNPDPLATCEEDVQSEPVVGASADKQEEFVSHESTVSCDVKEEPFCDDSTVSCDEKEEYCDNSMESFEVKVSVIVGCTD